MPVLPAVLLMLCLAALWYFVRRDTGEYAAFKLLTNTRDRQRRYLIWALRSFALFFGGTVMCLAVLHRLRGLFVMPSEMAGLAAQVRTFLPAHIDVSSGFIEGFIGAIAGGFLLGIFIVQKSTQPSKPVYLGDIEPLMPRNGPETFCTALLAMNAGLSEELFFRLLLPLLLTLLTGNALVAFVVAAILFGLVHLYQGAAGIIATFVLGVIFTVVYLATGNIWIPVTVHAAFDLVGLVIRPSITRAFASRT